MNNDFALTFYKNSQIKELIDDGMINKFGFECSSIKSLKSLGNKKTVDIGGVITEVTRSEPYTSKEGRTVHKHVWLVTDDSNHSVVITAWGKDFIEKHQHLEQGAEEHQDVPR